MAKPMNYCYFFIVCFFLEGLAQNMDPTVTITETDPPSTGYRVRGLLAKDVWLNCYVENLPAQLSVRWQRTMRDKSGRENIIEISQDTDVKDNMKWSIEKPTLYSWRLRIKAIEVQDEGIYSCFVILTNNNNRITANRTVQAMAKPIILEEYSTSDTMVTQGDNILLTCNSSGIPYPTIMWRREGDAVIPSGGVIVMGTELRITNIQYDARGRYICEAYNEVGTAKRDMLLSVLHPPDMQPDSDRVGQAIGYQRTLVCYVDADPAPIIEEEYNELYWSFNSQRMQYDDRRQYRILEGAYGRLAYELVILPVLPDDYGVYTCWGKNTIGQSFADIELFETTEPQKDKNGLIVSVASPVPKLNVILMFIFLLLQTSLLQ